MEQDDLVAIKAIELEIFDEFLRLAEKHDLEYFLTAGTCLGAVRHSGFIPWDDDIDVGMPRSEYERFERIAQEELDDRYVYQTMNTEPGCGFVFGKIRAKDTVLSEYYSYHLPMSQGVWLDIFPFDEMPDDPKEQKALYRKVSFLRNLYIVKCGYKMPTGKGRLFPILYYGAKLISKFVSRKEIISALEQAMTQYRDLSANYFYNYGTAYAAGKELIPRDVLFECEQANFEGRDCKVPRDTDAFLTHLYGDYMTLPPVEKRVGGMHHIHEFADNRKSSR
ncbi:LicD family protein [Anaerotardibacter muris]|uniref:LicD family protein n=1 Tax=Anaerotardibacter muris TaxID=2941505 RepID=UPI00203AB832|nr:LicD family protein [Anaerotardibacter muris]